MNFLHFIVVFILIKCNTCLIPASLEKAYEKGVKAYSEERWSRCIEKFEESLHLHKLFKSVVINCRIKCNTQPYEPRVKEVNEDLSIFEKYFNIKNCVDVCQKNGLEAVNLKSYPDEYVLKQMHDKKPYDYLHICYFQMHMFQSATSAAYTYLVAHPDDTTMNDNVQYYISQPEVDAEEMIDLEGDDYVLLYKLGRKSYNRDNWAETVVSMEEAIKDYIAAENYCRVECEEQPGQQLSTDFVTTLSSNMASLLECRQHCQDKLKILKYNSGVEFLADILNYIQMSFYHLEKYEEAAEVVATILVLKPNDEDTKANEEFYSKLIEKKLGSKRYDVIHYKKRDTHEKNLLHFFHQKE